MRVTEKKEVKIDRDCKANPVFFSWINTLGGREHWLFHKVQTKGLNTSAVGDFQKGQSDLENSRGQTIDLSIDATPQLVVGAYVDIEDVEGIKTILYSVMVERLMNIDTWQIEGPKWQIYRPNVGSFKLYDTTELKTTIEITFSEPSINNLSQ